MPRYVQPIARHLVFPERFLLRGEDDRWFVWTGERANDEPEEIASPTAHWLLTRPWIVPVAGAGAWVHVDDLPIVPEGRPAPRS